MQILRYVVAFECLTMFPQEVFRVASPLWQTNCIHSLLIRPDPHVQILVVSQKISIVLEKLRD